MPVDFIHQRQHVKTPRAPAPEGRVVMSQLPGGQSLVPRSAVGLKIVLQGEERYEASGRSYVLSAGSIMVADIGEEMELKMGSAGGAVGLCIYLPTPRSTALDPLMESMAGSPLILPLIDHPFGGWLTDLAKTLSDQPADGPSAAAAVLMSARQGLNRFVQDAAGKADSLAGGKAATRIELLRRVEIARAHLHDVQDRAVSLNELAAVAGLSPFHLARCFRQAHGAPPAAYHRNLRLAHAAGQLSIGARPAQLARQLGFADQASFTRAFTRRFGRPPGETRQNAAADA